MKCRKLNTVERGNIDMHTETVHACVETGENDVMNFIFDFLARFEKEFEKAVLEKQKPGRKKYDSSRLFYIASRRKLGLKLRELRKKAGLTRDEAIKLVNLKSPVMITYYEIGRSFPPEEYIEKLGKLAHSSDEEIEELKRELRCLKIVRFQPTVGCYKQTK